MEQTVRKKGWEDFMSLGQAPLDMNNDILESWKRSARHPIADRTCAPILGEDDLAHRRALARRLERAAQTALGRSRRLLIGTQDILLLSDSTGVVIEAVGDPNTLSRAEENHLHTGGRWAEEEIGTNAIGTALHRRAPTLIQDAEHFCEAIQRWNCAATPVMEPGTGRVLGVVDISWPVGIRQPNAVALSSALALQIETELTHMLGRDREALLERLHLRRLRRGNDPMLIMDRSGANVFSTEDFSRFCDDDDALRHLRQQLPDLMDQSPDRIRQVLATCMQGTDLEVISEQGDAIGVLISLRRPRLQASGWAGQDLRQIVNSGEVSANLLAQAQKLATTTISILIEGETGTGKTELARAIHRASQQSDGPFEMIDCAQLTEEQLREALTNNRYGGDSGVLCLGNPGASSPAVQTLLLTLVDQVAEQGTRIIAFSSRSLYEAMNANSFRSDLYYRIAGARLQTTPLRQRPDEVEPSLRRLVQAHATEHGRRELRFTSGAMAALKAYAWPGNLLEMRNLVITLNALSPTGLIDERTLPQEFHPPARRDRTETLRDMERMEILSAIEVEAGNLSRVARRLGIARSTLYLKLDSYGISRRRKV